jgi:transposase InsO family protein
MAGPWARSASTACIVSKACNCAREDQAAHAHRAAAWQGGPGRGNKPELEHGFRARLDARWAHKCGVSLDYTRRGKPTHNGLIESINGRLRDEFLNVSAFITMHRLRQKLNASQQDYKHRRPHSSLGHLTPRAFIQRGRGNGSRGAKLQFITV